MGSQNCPGVWPGPKELLLLMANSSGNTTVYLYVSPPPRETLALLSGFDLKQKRRVQYWWEEGYESLKAKVSWILCSSDGSSPAGFPEIGELRQRQHSAWCCKGWTMPSYSEILCWNCSSTVQLSKIITVSFNIILKCFTADVCSVTAALQM